MCDLNYKLLTDIQDNKLEVSFAGRFTNPLAGSNFVFVYLETVCAHIILIF